MCNLYTYKLSRDEMAGLMQHYKLIGQVWAEDLAKAMQGLNASGEVYPKYTAPVVIEQNGVQVLDRLKWGMPGPFIPGQKSTRPRFISNVRNTVSKHWTPWLAAAEVVVGKDKNAGGRCLVPAAAFAEPDEHTSKPVINRWFKRTDGLPFFFAGVWREWTGDHGTIKAPDVAKHRLFAFLTTDVGEDVRPVHSKATPLILRTPADVEQWLHGTAAEALELQKTPAPKGTLTIAAGGKDRKDEG